MKNYLYILSVMMLSGTLAACSSTMNNSEKNDDKLVKATSYAEQKESKDTAWLKEKARYQFEVMAESEEYSVFIHAEDEQAVMGEEKAASGKNQSFTGTYFIYLAKKDSSVAYKQIALGKKVEGSFFTFNSSSNQANLIKLGKNAIIVALEPKDQGIFKPFFYAIKDGEIKRISTDDRLNRISGLDIKSINQKYLQTAFLEENHVWKFHTWEFNEKTFSIIHKDESALEFQSKELGEYWYKRWSEKRELYYPFHNLKLSHDMVEKAKQGIPLGSTYPIGTNIANIKKSEVNFMGEGVVNGTPYLMYPEITYYYEATGTVMAISIPGERVKTTIKEIKKLLGQPEQEMVNSSGEMQIAYDADKYVIKVVSYKNGKVKTIYLSRK